MDGTPIGDGGEVSWVTDPRYGKVTLFLLDCCKKRLILTTDERKDEVVHGGVCVGAPSLDKRHVEVVVGDKWGVGRWGAPGNSRLWVWVWE